jgi:thiamine-phosphate pyrophosphorylase
MIKPSYLTLYAVLDTDYLLQTGKDPLKALHSCLKGGATSIQLRSKKMEDNEFYITALRMKKICSGYKIPLIINDRVDIAVLVNADGVHIGKKDLPFLQVKKMFNGIIGVSADSLKESFAADKLHASYIGVGPVYPTPLKEKNAIGIENMQTICSKLTTPIVAIGGINEYNIPELKRCGIKYFSFISGVFGSKNILAKTKKVKSIIYRREQ